MFLGDDMEPAILPSKSGSTIGECGVCEHVSWIVALDAATGWKICQECVRDSLTADYFLVKNGGLLRMRHPKPKEFRGKRDR